MRIIFCRILPVQVKKRRKIIRQSSKKNVFISFNPPPPLIPSLLLKYGILLYVPFTIAAGTNCMSFHISTLFLKVSTFFSLFNDANARSSFLSTLDPTPTATECTCSIRRFTDWLRSNWNPLTPCWFDDVIPVMKETRIFGRPPTISRENSFNARFNAFSVRRTLFLLCFNWLSRWSNVCMLCL